jgi:hypothetical protein
VGRELNQPAEDLIHSFEVLLKSYLSFESTEDHVDHLEVSPGVTTICISPHGRDQVDQIGQYKLPYPVKYAAEYIVKCKLPERFQVLLSCDPQFLEKEWPSLNQLKSSMPTQSRHLRWNQKSFEKYWDRQSGSVSIPTINDIVETLEKFYQNPKLRQKEGEYCYQRIRQICDRSTADCY